MEIEKLYYIKKCLSRKSKNTFKGKTKQTLNWEGKKNLFTYVSKYRDIMTIKLREDNRNFLL